jgi:hypothetical protein
VLCAAIVAACRQRTGARREDRAACRSRLMDQRVSCQDACLRSSREAPSTDRDAAHEAFEGCTFNCQDQFDRAAAQQCPAR